MIAPSISELRPMYVELSTMERTTRPRSRTVTLDASTTCGPTRAPREMRQ
jgi:hypothetical protein